MLLKNLFVTTAIILGLSMGPPLAHAADCAAGDAEVFFDRINGLMQSSNREALAWNNVLAEVAEDVAARIREGQTEKDIDPKAMLLERGYDLSSVALTSAVGVRDSEKASEQYLEDAAKTLLAKEMKSIGIACLGGAGKNGPYRVIVTGIQKLELPESEYPKCGPDFAHQVLDYTNEYREKLKVPPLAWNEQLAMAAKTQADYMASTDTMQHDGPDGTSVADRAKDAGYEYRIIAENVAAGQETPLVVFTGWRKSPGHEKNLRHPDVTEMGAACANGIPSRFQIFWAQVFGKPKE